MPHDPIPKVLAGKRVLIAEDDAILAMYAESVVGELGGEVLGCARSSNAALDLLNQSLPDLVLLDVNLGRGTSEGVLQAAQEMQVPVLVSSGSNPNALPPAFQDLPTLAKPWTPDEFAIAAASLLLKADHAIFGFPVRAT